MTGMDVVRCSTARRTSCPRLGVLATPSLAQRRAKVSLAGALQPARLIGCRQGAKRLLGGPPASMIRSLVSLQPRQEKIVENESQVNKKVLVSAAAVCFLTHVLTVQGMLLAGYLAAATAVPVGAVNHAIKRRNALPALCILLPLLLTPHVGILRAMYTSVVNPVSVQIKAHITLPAAVHALVGCKHPALRAGMQSAKVASQIVLLVLLLQYLFAPKLAHAMRQRAIMLCRAFTTTESQGMRFKDGEATLETWPNKQHRSDKSKPGHEGFVSSISRGDPQKWQSTFPGSASQNAEHLESRQQAQSRNLPEGQPSITEVYAHSDASDSHYSFVSEKRLEAARQRGSYGSGIATDVAPGELLWDKPNSDRRDSVDLEKHMAGLGLTFESASADEKAAAGISSELDTVVDSITSPEELFEVLNEQLNMVHSLSDEIRNKGLALQKSEEAREDLVRELEATVGEKRQLGDELTHLSLKFDAAQSMWERHLEEGGSFNDLLSEEMLEKIIEAFTERSKSRVFADDAAASLDAEDCNVLDGDALAAKFRIHPDERHNEGAGDGGQNNAQPFSRASSAISSV